jgi:hypothetical protein
MITKIDICIGKTTSVAPDESRPRLSFGYPELYHVESRLRDTPGCYVQINTYMDFSLSPSEASEIANVISPSAND